jgi:hypothetical protein
MGSNSILWPAWARREPSRPPILHEEKSTIHNLTANPLLEGFGGVTRRWKSTQIKLVSHKRTESFGIIRTDVEVTNSTSDTLVSVNTYNTVEERNQMRKKSFIKRERRDSVEESDSKALQLINRSWRRSLATIYLCFDTEAADRRSIAAYDLKAQLTSLGPRFL